MGIVPRSDQHRHCGDRRINGLACIHEAEMAKHDRIRTDATLGTPRIPVELWGRDCIEVVAKRNSRHGYLVPKSGRPPVQLADRVVGDRDDAVCDVLVVGAGPEVLADPLDQVRAAGAARPVSPMVPSTGLTT